MLGIVVFLLGLGLLVLGISAYPSRWRLPLGLRAEVRFLVAVLVLVALSALLFGIVSTALHADGAEGDLMVRCAQDRYGADCTMHDDNPSRRVQHRLRLSTLV